MNHKQLNTQYHLVEAIKWESGQYVKVSAVGYYDLEEFGFLGRIWLRIRAWIFEVMN